jgi:hypothetical protein
LLLLAGGAFIGVWLGRGLFKLLCVLIDGQSAIRNLLAARLAGLGAELADVSSRAFLTDGDSDDDAH